MRNRADFKAALLQVWPQDASFTNILVHLVDLVVVERWNAREHFVDEHADSPPICLLTVAIARQHFRRHVLGRTTECITKRRLLGQSEVEKLDVAVLVKYNILWLQIPIYYVELFVQVAEREHYLRYDKFSLVLVETLHLLDVAKQFTASYVVHDEVDTIALLEHVVHLDNERVIDGRHDELLQLSRLNKILLK